MVKLVRSGLHAILLQTKASSLTHRRTGMVALLVVQLLLVLLLMAMATVLLRRMVSILFTLTL